MLALNARFFRFDLSGLADFQYALYGGPEGGHFEWHKDYGRDPSDPQREPRKLTLSLQLSAPSDYDGCELQVRGGHQIDIAPKTRGTLVGFPGQCAAPGDAHHAGRPPFAGDMGGGAGIPLKRRRFSPGGSY